MTITRARTLSRITRPRPPVTCHIRREDECEITYCGRLTSPCDDPADTRPITMSTGRDVAIYPDVESPAGTMTCLRCGYGYTLSQELTDEPDPAIDVEALTEALSDTPATPTGRQIESLIARMIGATAEAAKATRPTRPAV